VNKTDTQNYELTVAVIYGVATCKQYLILHTLIQHVLNTFCMHNRPPHTVGNIVVQEMFD